MYGARLSTRRKARQQGVAFLASLFAIIVIFGLVSAVTLFVTAQSRARSSLLEETQAFYLAEAGLESGKWELANGEDPDGDGAGRRSATRATGSYVVTSEDLGGGVYRLTSTGTAGETTWRLQETVSLTSGGTPFPTSAMVMAGALPASGVQFKTGVYGPGGSKTFILDGGASPGMGFTDGTTYNSVGDLFANHVSNGDLDPANLSGSTWNTFNGVDLPFYEDTSSDDYLLEIAQVYTEIRDHVENDLVPGSENKTIGSESTITFGSSGSPGAFYFGGDETLKIGQTLTGHGSLVVDKYFKVENGATLDWQGDLIVFGDDSQDAFLEVDGSFNVTGNVVVVGHQDRYSKLVLKPNGAINVTGALTAISDGSSSSQIQFLMEGTTTVDGILSVLGPEIQAEFKDPSQTTVTGMLQIGAPSGASDFLLKFEGDFEAYNDGTGISTGSNALGDLKTNLSLANGDSILGGGETLESIAWERVALE